MNKKLFLLTVFISLNSFSNNDSLVIDSLRIISNQKDSVLESLEQELLIANIYSDSLLNTKEDIKPIESNGNSSELIIALVVGLIAFFGNLFISWLQRRSSDKQIERQLSDSQITLREQIKSSKDTLSLQINSSKTIATDQINSSEKNAELQFRQHVLSSNRQNWINELRDIMSEIFEQVEFSSIIKKVDHKDYRKLERNIIKVELMLNPIKDAEFIEALKKLKNVLMKEVFLGDGNYRHVKESKENVLDFAKKTLKTEWERVKLGK